METLAAVIILLLLIAYIAIRLIVFYNAVRRDREKRREDTMDAQGKGSGRP